LLSDCDGQRSDLAGGGLSLSHSGEAKEVIAIVRCTLHNLSSVHIGSLASSLPAGYRYQALLTILLAPLLLFAGYNLQTS